MRAKGVRKPAKPEPRFAAGDRVRVSDRAFIRGDVGLEARVRGRRLELHGRGSPWAGQPEWVYVLDVESWPGHPEAGYRTYWERLLDPAQ